MTSMFVGMSGSSDDSSDGQESMSEVISQPVDPNGDKVVESRMMTRMFSSIGKNDLASLKEYFDSGNSGIEDHANSIFYEYPVTPQIFDADTSDGVRQINPDTSFSSLGIGSGSSSNSIMSMSMSTDAFDEMPSHHPFAIGAH